MIRVAIHGATGRMGRAVAAIIAADEHVSVVGAFAHRDDPRQGEPFEGAANVRVSALGASEAELAEVDVVIDFTAPRATGALAVRCLATRTPLVSGTTGLDEDAEIALGRLAEVAPVVHAPNMSAGVTLLFHLAEIAASRLRGFDAEIVEMHHRHKVDAPSGTAVRLAEHVARARELDPVSVVRTERSGAVGPRPDDEIGVMTLRGGAVVGDHTLHLVGDSERLELSHRAMDRSIFARGAVRAAGWVVGREPARYGMADVLGLSEA